MVRLITLNGWAERPVSFSVFRLCSHVRFLISVDSMNLCDLVLPLVNNAPQIRTQPLPISRRNRRHALSILIVPCDSELGS